MRKISKIILIVAMASSVLTGCMNEKIIPSKEEISQINNLNFNFSVDPETLALEVESNGITEKVSEPLERMKVSNLEDSGDNISWSYLEQGIDVDIEKKENYVDVAIKSSKVEDNTFIWPKVNGDGYMLPFNQGKYIPSNDSIWTDYLNEGKMKVIEALSMQFFAVDKSEYSLVYIIRNPYNSEIDFNTENGIEFAFNHEFPQINEEKEYGFRIYLTEKNTVDVAKTYKNYLIEQGDFKSLADKAEENSNIEKLYGAPHVYFWDRTVISEENIKWAKLKESLPEKLKLWIQELLTTKVEDGSELSSGLEDLNNLDYVDNYTKNRILKGLSAVMQLKEFYNQEIFTDLDKETQGLLDRGIAKLNAVELIDLNKRLLKSVLGNVVDPIEEWAAANTVDVIKDMKDSGLEYMWIGLDDWQEGFIKPELIKKAEDLGYLIGTYDSYHSIHEPGKEKWETAKFKDTSLYEDATVTNKDGSKIEGFQGVGRKLNPTLAMPSVEERVTTILSTGIAFNSWFLDTDGTGEIYDDYSPEHITTENEDIQARIKRMEYLQKEWNMVVGTEGGNDFANKTIAFAHGIETPSFSWMDADMAKNKESEYYVGRYYSSTGGVPELFSKQIPIKEKYKKLFLDTDYTIPLYKLVYNDSVITSYWWGWGSLKFEDEIVNRMLYEILYNVPPLYHIDKVEWEKHKETIVKHSKVWSKFSEKAIKEEMTDFRILSDDKLVQMTAYGEELSAVTNFSEDEFNYHGEIIPGKSVLIIDGDSNTIYSPEK
ncbi:glycoside hydrolase [Paenibacillus endoradicis]|uniref:glycoside hydrolase n=1 Tax=Paenibacillus endoradicis TaxID=2972487 RepID=UPI002158DE5A|nr:glycoside hydrolase [Paenibacillus endoradicis]MCR8656133.1 glycoside hydrolase [Paenibacillus endoradicis]MCR8658459.1 glycoside hydrolase [Paenibacillus endoradicis]